jgi:predicted hydrocarbon binding protein
MSGSKDVTSHMEADQGEVKGVQVRAAYLFMKERYGDVRVEAALRALDQEDRVLMPNLLLDSNWYPHTAWRAIRRISRAVDPTAGKDLTVDMGKYMAEYSFKGVYRSLLSADPAKQVENFQWIHDFFYRNVCRIEANVVDKNSAVVAYYYEKGAKITGATCLILMGFWTRTLELSGGKQVKAAHPKCMGKGAGACEYRFDWQ